MANQELIMQIKHGEDPPHISTSEELHVRSASGMRTVATFENEKDLSLWFQRHKRAETLRVFRVTRIEEEVQKQF